MVVARLIQWRCTPLPTYQKLVTARRRPTILVGDTDLNEEPTGRYLGPFNVQPGSPNVGLQTVSERLPEDPFPRDYLE